MSDIYKIKAENLKAYGPVIGNRWFQLIVALVSMVMIANLQYAWTLFAIPVAKNVGSTLSIVQYAFTIYVIMQTFSQPVAGYLFDRMGQSGMFALAGIFVGVGWGMMGQAHSVASLYFFYALAGAGAGIVYGGSVSAAVRWFPDRRGFCSGLVVAGYGMGCMPFIPWISGMLELGDIGIPFMRLGILQGVVLIIASFLLRYPINSKAPAKQDTSVDPEKIGFKPSEMVKTPHFWLIWSMFFGITVGGLIVTANTTPFGKEMGIATTYIMLAVTLNSFANGISRIFWGWISDKVGRYKTMTISFGLNAVFLFLLPFLGGHSSVVYVTCLAGIMFTFGEAFSLFPAVNADLFGTTYSASNYGILNSAKGTASLFGGGLGVLLASSFGWSIVFAAAALLSLYASVMSVVLPRLTKPKKKISNSHFNKAVPSLR